MQAAESREGGRGRGDLQRGGRGEGERGIPLGAGACFSATGGREGGEEKTIGTGSACHGKGRDRGVINWEHGSTGTVL